MKSTRSMDDLVLHTVGDALYFGTGRPQAAVFERGPEEFVEQEWVHQAEAVRILGTAENARLIVALHNHRLRNGGPKIFLGSPSLCHLEKEPHDVIRQLMEIEWPAAVGGWHLMTPTDYPSYALMDAFGKSQGAMTGYVRTLLAAHPAYPALDFIPTLDDMAATHLLCHMTDPRFHVDPKSPDAVSKLKQFFGLGEPSGVFNVLAWRSEDANEAGNRFGLAMVVLDTWSSGWEKTIAQDVVGPRDFLMRVVKRVCEKAQPAMGLLRASHVFLRFLRYTWLDSLTPSRKYQFRKRKLGKERRTEKVRTMCREKVYSPTLFVPEYFFVHKDEAEAWREYSNGRK